MSDILFTEKDGMSRRKFCGSLLGLFSTVFAAKVLPDINKPLVVPDIEKSIIKHADRPITNGSNILYLNGMSIPRHYIRHISVDIISDTIDVSTLSEQMTYMPVASPVMEINVKMIGDNEMMKELQRIVVPMTSEMTCALNMNNHSIVGSGAITQSSVQFLYENRRSSPEIYLMELRVSLYSWHNFNRV